MSGAEPTETAVEASGSAGQASTIEHWIDELVRRRGTDLHITSGSAPLIRHDGRLARLPDVGVLDGPRIRAELQRWLEPGVWARYEQDWQADFGIGWRGVARLRGNVFRQRGDPALALRLIPHHIPSFDEIGLPPAVRDLIKLSQGLVLFTGPTGSGKSTSMASLINEINDTRQCHVLTLEDPIEYVHRHKSAVVNQREIGADAQSFEAALRSALREDPDVLLVGEMRDNESIAMTLTLAETGHLVFSTLHTNDTGQAIDRIVDVFPGERQAQIRLQLAGCLNAVVGQSLLPKIGGGLIAAYEVMIGTMAVRNLIREGKTRQLRNQLTTGQGVGMCTLEMSLSDLVKRKQIYHGDAVAVSAFPAEIAKA